MRMTNSQRLRVAGASLASACLLGLACQGPEPATTETPVQPAPCQEDMPCWDCRTMGNKICGEVHEP
jgi:hypothetical protein